MTAATAMAVGRWISAVIDHTPGVRDESVERVSALTFEDRRELNTGMGLFLTALKGKAAVVKSEPARQIVRLGQNASQNPGAAMFLKRAAVLHSDTAMQRTDSVHPVDPASLPEDGPATTPLLSHHRLFLDKDGEILGEIVADWNWPFARSLLDLVAPRASEDPFVGAWYHATSAFMLQNLWFGEVVTHLQRAAVVLPEDARVLYDRACFAETQGLDRSQVLLTDQDLMALRARRTGQRPPRLVVSAASQLGIPPGEITNAEAERLFRHALRVDPNLVEARVRLGRLLEERKRYEEAAGELGAALSAKPVGELAFFANLFAGRAARARGRLDEASARFSAAVALFPGAQSALLGQSQAALLGSDVAGALESIRRLEQLPANAQDRDDPWWIYGLGPGREADALLDDIWRQVTRR